MPRPLSPMESAWESSKTTEVAGRDERKRMHEKAYKLTVSKIMIWVSSYLKLPSCPAAFIAAATDTQLCLELKIHKCFLKKLLI